MKPTPEENPGVLVVYAATALAALATILLCCCASHRQPVAAYSHDTARVVVRERVVWRTDTVTITPPAERRERETRDTASVLRTSLAESRAVWSGGTLTHTLANIAQPVRVPVPARTIYIDSTATRTRVLTVEKPVERKLTAWERLRLKWFGPLAIAVLLMVAWTGRKPIARIARNLLAD